MTQTDGLLIVDKELGITSHDVVARARRILGTRKVGHAGTLDPAASGVLVLGVGRATRLLGYLSGHDKTYRATIRLGQATTTDDAEGEPLESVVDPSRLTSAQISDAVAALTGQLDQVPSAVSAIKVDGRRAYARVRAGEQVELAARPVVVRRFDVLREAACGPFRDVEVEVECSAGTYVRALARDLGAALGVGGHVTALRRTVSGRFDESCAASLPDARALEPEALALLRAQTWGRLVPIGAALQLSFPSVQVDAQEAARVRSGQPLNLPDEASGPVALLGPLGQGLALVTPRPPGPAKYLAVFA